MPLITQLTFENNSKLTVIVDKPSSDTYVLVERKLFASAFQKDNSRVISTKDRLYSFSTDVSEGSCFRLESTVADCPPSPDVCLPEWELYNEEGKNTIKVSPKGHDRIELLKNNLQIDRQVSPSGPYEVIDPNIMCRQEEVYRLVARQNGCLIVSNKKAVKALAGSCAVVDVMLPTSFSPNGDGHNDSLGCLGEQRDFYSLTIFDRWRNRIFQTSAIDVFWNGTLDNTDEPAPAGNYIYVLKKLNANAEVIIQTGQVLLVR